MEPSIAYLSQGDLLVKLPGEASRIVESAFARQVRDRQARELQAHGWKNRGGIWGNMGMEPPGLAQWEGVADRRVMNFRGVARGGEPGRLFYVLELGTMAGLFHYDLAADSERRLLHRNDFRATDLHRHPRHGDLAMTVAREDGSTSLCISEADGRQLREITPGNSVDEAPAWIPGDGRQIVYQSAPIVRDDAGFAVGLGPYAIELVDIDREEISTLVEDEAADFLQPKRLADGTLYYVRRPYKPPGRDRIDGLALLKDIVFFPFRLARAVFYFLNFFSVMFSGKPLTTAGGALRRQTADTRYLMVWGRMIDTKRAMEKARQPKTADLVPEDWQLIRRAPDGRVTVLAENVLSYDVCDDGGIAFTNGSVIVHLDAAGNRRELCTDRMIEKVIVTG